MACTHDAQLKVSRHEKSKESSNQLNKITSGAVKASITENSSDIHNATFPN